MEKQKAAALVMEERYAGAADGLGETLGRLCSPAVPELRNVSVFALGAVRCALEMRWVREVVTLGFVTNVPSAPTALAGVCNLHGAILPVLDLSALLGGPLG